MQLKQKTESGTLAWTMDLIDIHKKLFCPKTFPEIFSWQKHTFAKKKSVWTSRRTNREWNKKGFFSYVAFSDTHMQYFIGCNSAKESARETEQTRTPPRQHPRVSPFTHVLMGKIRQIAGIGRLLPIGAESFHYLDSSYSWEGKSRGVPMAGASSQF